MRAQRLSKGEPRENNNGGLPTKSRQRIQETSGTGRARGLAGHAPQGYSRISTFWANLPPFSS